MLKERHFYPELFVECIKSCAIYICYIACHIIIGGLCCKQDFMHAVAADPKVLSILSKNHSEKGYRFHQGPRLRLLLSSLEQTMVCSCNVFLIG